jgi:hypothetical protein
MVSRPLRGNRPIVGGRGFGLDFWLALVDRSWLFQAKGAIALGAPSTPIQEQPVLPSALIDDEIAAIPPATGNRRGWTIAPFAYPADTATPATTIDAELEAVATALAEVEPRSKRLVLFGPRARGDARPDSDLDLLVVML